MNRWHWIVIASIAVTAYMKPSQSRLAFARQSCAPIGQM